MANEEMIQKHLDNFLAKIAGETPVDEEPRDSTEFWLNEIAEQGGGGTEVVANPTLEGGEDDLTSIEIDGTKYAIPEGSSVEANPTLAGTEADLVGVEIDGVRYAVPKGAYIATKTSNSQISVESLNYIYANYKTIPCYVEYSSAVYRIVYRVGAKLYTDGYPNSPGTSNGSVIYMRWLIITDGRITEISDQSRTVIANPSGTGTATLTNLTVGSTIYNVPQGTEVAANPTLVGTESDLTGLDVGGTKYKVRDGVTNGLGYLTTAPTSANNDGIKIVVLSAEPATKYNGYLYIILA